MKVRHLDWTDAESYSTLEVPDLVVGSGEFWCQYQLLDNFTHKFCRRSLRSQGRIVYNRRSDILSTERYAKGTANVRHAY